MALPCCQQIYPTPTKVLVRAAVYLLITHKALPNFLEACGSSFFYSRVLIRACLPVARRSQCLDRSQPEHLHPITQHHDYFSTFPTSSSSDSSD